MFICAPHCCVGHIARDEAKGWGVEDIWIMEGSDNVSQLRLERYDMVSDYYVLCVFANGSPVVKPFISLIDHCRHVF